MIDRDYPTGAAQETILKALGLKASGFNEANEIFAKIGIVVASKRVGRSSVPVVTQLSRYSGGWNAGGDGDSYENNYESVDLSRISQWMEK